MADHGAQGSYDFRPLQGASSHPDFGRGLAAIVALVVVAVPTETPDGTVIDHPFWWGKRRFVGQALETLCNCCSCEGAV